MPVNRPMTTLVTFPDGDWAAKTWLDGGSPAALLTEAVRFAEGVKGMPHAGAYLSFWPKREADA